MPSTFSTGRAHLEKPSNGSDVDTWDVPINSNADSIDNCFSATTSLTLSNVNVNLNQAQMQCARVALLGTLSGNVQVNFLGTVPGFYVVQSFVVQGAFSITLGTTLGGLTLAIGLGSTLVFTDGVNVLIADDAGARQIAALFVPPGAIMDFAMSTAPSGWLVCDGSAVSRTGATLALFNNIGTTWGVGNGSTTFNLPNFQGRFRRTWDQSGVVDPARAFASLQADAFKTHTHGVNDPQHSHTVPVIAAVNQAGFNNSSPLGGGAVSVTTSSSSTGITIQNAGDTETRPTNYAVLTCIKT